MSMQQLREGDMSKGYSSHTMEQSLTHSDQVAVVLQHDIPVEVLLRKVQLLPLLQGEVHKHISEGQ